MNVAWPQAVIFDLDGTLVDSTSDIAMAANAALAQVGISATDGEVRGWLGGGAQSLIEKALHDYSQAAGCERVARLTADFVAAYQACPVRYTVPFVGVHEALAELAAADVRMAVCTNKPEPVARQVLDDTGLSRHIRVLVGGGAYPLKPDPSGLQACMAALHVTAKQTAYVGDQAVDITTARRAGVPVIAAGFGYAAGGASTLGADALLDSWSRLPQCLQQLRAGLMV